MSDKLTPKQINQVLLSITNHLPPQKGDEGRYSAKKTLEQIQSVDPNVRSSLFNYIKYFSISPRSQVLASTAKKAPRYSSPVPLVLSAYKEFNDIGYDEWDKNDKFLPLFVGEHLYEHYIAKAKNIGLITKKSEDTSFKPFDMNEPFVLQVYKQMGKEAILELRELNDGGSGSISRGSLHFLINGKDHRLPQWDLIRHCILQSWVFSQELRNKYMILDPYVWDFVPDGINKSVVKSKLLGELFEESSFDEFDPRGDLSKLLGIEEESSTDLGSKLPW